MYLQQQTEAGGCPFKILAFLILCPWLEPQRGKRKRQKQLQACVLAYKPAIINAPANCRECFGAAAHRLLLQSRVFFFFFFTWEKKKKTHDNGGGGWKIESPYKTKKKKKYHRLLLQSRFFFFIVSYSYTLLTFRLIARGVHKMCTTLTSLNPL